MRESFLLLSVARFCYFSPVLAAAAAAAANIGVVVVILLLLLCCVSFARAHTMRPLVIYSSSLLYGFPIEAQLRERYIVQFHGIFGHTVV